MPYFISSAPLLSGCKGGANGIPGPTGDASTQTVLKSQRANMEHAWARQDVKICRPAL